MSSYKEYHAAVNKLAADSLHVVSTSGDSVWDADAMICGLDTAYSEDAALVFRVRGESIRLYEEDVQGLVQYLTTILPLFKERDAVTAAHKKQMQFANED